VMRAVASHFPLLLRSSPPQKLGGLPVVGGVQTSSSDGSMAGMVRSGSLKGGSTRAPSGGTTTMHGGDFDPPMGCSPRWR
jgi:hypothetical protein